MERGFCGRGVYAFPAHVVFDFCTLLPLRHCLHQ